MQLTPEMIREQRFKAKLSGFDKDEVTNFLIDVADDFDELLEENALCKSELETLKNKQKDLEDLFLSAKQFSDEKIRKAQEEADKILAEAQNNASSIEQQAQQTIEEAQSKTNDILEEARQKAAEILQEAQKDKSGLENELAELRAKRTNLFSELKAVLDSYRSWIREMGDVDTK